MGVLGAIGPWADLSWEPPLCKLVSTGVAVQKKQLTWKQYAMAAIMVREARTRKGSMTPWQAALQFLYCNDFTAGWAIHSTPYYGNHVITPHVIQVINRPSNVGIQRSHIILHDAYADEESYTIAVNPTFRGDPNILYETFGADNAAGRWITWDDVWIASRAVQPMFSWNQTVPMYQDGSYLEIDTFSPANVLMLRWAYRYARGNGITICEALTQMSKAKAMNVSLSTTGVDEFSGVTLQKTYRVYITKSGWYSKNRAFGPTLVIPPADVRDSNRRNQNEDTRKRQKRMPPSSEFYLLESMSLPNPYWTAGNPKYTSPLGYSTRPMSWAWNNLIVAARKYDLAHNGNYTLAYSSFYDDTGGRGYPQLVMFDHPTMRDAEDPNMVRDSQGRTAYDIWAQDDNYGVHIDGGSSPFDDIVQAAQRTGDRIGTIDDGAGPAGSHPGAVRG